MYLISESRKLAYLRGLFFEYNSGETGIGFHGAGAEIGLEDYL